MRGKPTYLCWPKSAQRPSQWLSYIKTQKKCAVVQNVSCVLQVSAAGAPLGLDGVLYVAGRDNGFPSSLSFTQQQPKAMQRALCVETARSSDVRDAQETTT